MFCFCLRCFGLLFCHCPLCSVRRVFGPVCVIMRVVSQAAASEIWEPSTTQPTVSRPTVTRRRSVSLVVVVVVTDDVKHPHQRTSKNQAGRALQSFGCREVSMYTFVRFTMRLRVRRGLALVYIVFLFLFAQPPGGKRPDYTRRWTLMVQRR